jgi:hypothetical protein
LLSAPQPDEVVEVFTGDTLEEAMAYAVAGLGPDLTVRRARRVRKGVQGLRGKERYEVVAVPAPRAAAEDDAVDPAFAALLERAEQDEDPQPVRRTARPAHDDAPPVVLESVPQPRLPEPPRLEAPALTTLDRPAVVVPAPAAPATVRRPRPAARPTPRRAAPAAPAPRRTAETAGWGRTALRELGLPRAVLAALPAKEPRTDMAWVAALTKAFASVLPEADPTAAVCVSGTGLEGVRGILAAARKGMTPGTITYAGRTAPATAMELALCVRAEVLR